MSSYGPKWSTQRAERLAIDEYTCQDCGNEAWQVHHIEYAPEGETASLEKLVSLCPDCHGSRHGVRYISPVEKPPNIERKTITIREDQDEWIEEQHLNLSSFIRDQLDQLIDERG